VRTRTVRRPRPSRSLGIASVSLPGRRALTLIELLAAIAVMVVLSAIAMPVIAGRVAGARFEAAARQVESIVVLSRAESQRRGEALNLVAVRLGRSEQFRLEPWEGGDEKQPGTGAETSGVLLGELGEGVSISQRPPATADGPAGASSERGTTVHDAALLGAATSEERVVIATFLPDGTAAVGGPIYLSERGRTVVVKLNAWTGAAKVEEFVPPDDSGSGEQKDAKEGRESTENTKEM